MPKLIPENISEETASSAERYLFDVIKRMEDTDEWTVLHSLNIAKHTTQRLGEADFVILIPSEGIFILEIKGGIISVEDGIWYSEDQDGRLYKIKNPITEASEAMFSIMNHIQRNDTNHSIGKTNYGFGVVFPNTTMHGEYNSVELADEQTADCDDCLNPETFKNYILRLAKYWKNKNTTGIRPPDTVACNLIAKLLRQNLQGKVSLKSQIRNVENQVVELTENQQSVFDTISENDRCLVRGDAGTGKTIIALHFAYHKAEEGKKTGFFCYNKQLAAYLKENVPDDANFTCDSFTEYMDKIVTDAGKKPEISDTSEYYISILPHIFMETFLEKEMEQFDCLIIDEAQDLMSPEWIEALDFILKGGLSEGSWYLFMDAKKQNIFRTGASEEDIIGRIEEKTKHYTKCRLTENCRNSSAIIEKIDEIFGSETRHRHTEEKGANVVIKSYKNSTHQVEKLNEILKTLKDEGIEQEDITILSPVRFDYSATSSVTDYLVTTQIENRKEAIYFSTIQGFKGLESPVVVLTDISDLSSEERKNLLYVGMTRAKSALYILAKEDVVDGLK